MCKMSCFCLNKPYLVFSAPSTGVSNNREAKSYCSWFKTKNASKKCVLSTGDSPPIPLCRPRQTRHSHDKMDQAFPLRFAYCNQSKTWTVGRPGNTAKRAASLGLVRCNLCDCLSCRILFGESRRRFAIKTWYTMQSFVLLPVSQCYTLQNGSTTVCHHRVLQLFVQLELGGLFRLVLLNDLEFWSLVFLWSC